MHAAAVETAADRPVDRGTDWPPGTHLVSPRRGYTHHGLYAGSGRVIHYAGFNRLLVRGPVEEVSLARFTRGRGVRAQAHVAPAFNGAAALERARSRLGEDRYRVMSNNCEHFVMWCLDGAARSAQIDRWARVWRRRWDRVVSAMRQAAALAAGGRLGAACPGAGAEPARVRAVESEREPGLPASTRMLSAAPSGPWGPAAASLPDRFGAA